MTPRTTACWLLVAVALVPAAMTLPLVTLLAQTTASTPANNPVTAANSRFGDPGSITGDPTGLRRDTTVNFRGGPRFPFDKVKPGTIGASVVAFVIDTTGRVEPPTITYVQSPPPQFRGAVCDYVRTMRFVPFDVGGTKMRVLLVQSYGFVKLFTIDSSVRAAQQFAVKTQEDFATHPISQAVAKLETLPHCD